VSPLVERPGDLAIEVREVDGVTLLTIHAAADDRGRLIGREGATLEALRTLVRAAAGRRGERLRLEVWT
jgi:predicted RNA-binding protein YlqC (UPF0109 family)